MHPFSILTLGIFVAGYITARWDLVTRLYELAIFAWDHGVVVRSVRSLRSPLRSDLARIVVRLLTVEHGIDSDFERVSLPLGVLLPSGSAY